MIFEGEIGKGSLGGIAVDDISISNHIPQEDCASEYGLAAETGRAYPGAQARPQKCLCCAHLDLEFQCGL